MFTEVIIFNLSWAARTWEALHVKKELQWQSLPNEANKPMHNYSILAVLKTPVCKASTMIGFELITKLHSSEIMPRFQTVINHDHLETTGPKSNLIFSLSICREIMWFTDWLWWTQTEGGGIGIGILGLVYFQIKSLASFTSLWLKHTNLAETQGRKVMGRCYHKIWGRSCFQPKLKKRTVPLQTTTINSS